MKLGEKLRAYVCATALALVACGPTTGEVGLGAGRDASEVALGVWALEHGPASERCAEDAMSASFTTYDAREMRAQCESVRAPHACLIRYDASGAEIALADTPIGQSLVTRAHELLHVLLACERFDPDAAHRDAVWR